MAYNNYFPTGYQPAQIYYPQNNYVPQQNAQVQQAQQPQQSNSKIYVQGDTGAKSYLVAPGASVTLWDSESPVFYEKSADYSGVPHVRKAVYAYEDETTQNEQNEAMANFATKDDVESIKKEIIALRAYFEPSDNKTKEEKKK